MRLPRIRTADAFRFVQVYHGPSSRFDYRVDSMIGRRFRMNHGGAQWLADLSLSYVMSRLDTNKAVIDLCLIPRLGSSQGDNESMLHTSGQVFSDACSLRLYFVYRRPCRPLSAFVQVCVGVCALAFHAHI